MRPGDIYTQGHRNSVLRSHRSRTAEHSAADLLPRLHTGQTLFGVGCGPGTITCDLAERLAPGRALGIDAASGVVEEALGDRTYKLRFGSMSESGRYVRPLRGPQRGDFKLLEGRGLAGAGVWPAMRVPRCSGPRAAGAPFLQDIGVVIGRYGSSRVWD